MRVFLNPGHDRDYDSGAVNADGIRECDIAWAVGLKVQEYLNAAGVETQIMQSGMEELEEGRNQEHLASSQHGMESELIKKEMVEHLHQCLQMLPKAERDLIYAIFYEEETESSYAERVGLTQSGVSRKCKMILAKLKKFMNKL